MKKTSHRLVLLTGPSCAGKTPLARSLAKWYPKIMSDLSPLVLFNSRDARPGEQDGVDYHFRSTDFIENLSHNERYLTLQARGGLQAIDLQDLQQLLRSKDIFFEGNTFTALKLIEYANKNDITTLSIFLSPITKEEFKRFNPVEARAIVFNLMREKLMRRHIAQGREAGEEELKNIDLRAGEAYSELLLAWQFDFVLPNHVGEDHNDWHGKGFPSGEAGRVLEAFSGLLSAGDSVPLEKWHRADFGELKEM